MNVFIEPSGVAGYADANLRPCVLFQNQLELGTLTASSEAVGYPVENLISGKTTDYWSTAALPAQVTTVLGGSTACDCLFVAAHTLFSTGTTVAVEYWNGSTWVQVADATPVNDKPFLLVWAEVSATQWRLNFSGVTTPIIVGVAILGKRLTFPVFISPSYTPFDFAQRVELQSSLSLKGWYNGTRIKRRVIETTINFPPIAHDVVRDELETFLAHFNDGKPFGMASSPSMYDTDVAYCWRAEGNTEARPTFTEDGIFMQLQLEVNGSVY